MENRTPTKIVRNFKNSSATSNTFKDQIIIEPINPTLQLNEAKKYNH